MKKIKSLFVGLGVACVLAAATAIETQAATNCGGGRRTPRVNARQRHQQQRIYGGVRSGELTRRETFRLEREQTQIQRVEWRAKRDGEVTARERVKLQRELNQASRHIYRAKHNGRDTN